jgi:hypothetical protein
MIWAVAKVMAARMLYLVLHPRPLVTVHQQLALVAICLPPHPLRLGKRSSISSRAISSASCTIVPLLARFLGPDFS